MLYIFELPILELVSSHRSHTAYYRSLLCTACGQFDHLSDWCTKDVILCKSEGEGKSEDEGEGPKKQKTSSSK